MGDAGGHGIGNDLEPGLALAQGRRPLGRPLLEHGLALLLCGDIGIERDETAAVRQWGTRDTDDGAVGANPVEAMGLEAPGIGDALCHLLLRNTGTILAAFGIIAHEIREISAEMREARRKFQQLQELVVPCDHAQISIEDRDPLIDAVKPGLDHRVDRALDLVSRHASSAARRRRKHSAPA